MDKELQAKLIASYPRIFRDAGKSPQETCMCWGCECGNGWFNVIDSLCSAIDDYRWEYTVDCTEDGRPDVSIDVSTHDFSVVADQVKEKFGTLRFYYHIEPPPSWNVEQYWEKYPKTYGKILSDIRRTFDGMVSMAETMSSRTCEETGNSGEMHSSGGWLKTLNVEFAKTYREGIYVPIKTLESDKADA